MVAFDYQTTLVPLTLLILIGWAIGRTQDIDIKSIASILIYSISPIVALGSTAQLSFHSTLILLPFITFILSTACGLSSFALGRRFLEKKDMGYLLPIATGSGNNGYFGLPLAMAVFAPEHIGIYFLITLGVTLYEATLGYYFIARGHLSAAAALTRVIRMPVIYAIAAGLILSALHVNLDTSLLKLWDVARGCYVCLGMMIIGISLAKHKRLAWDMDFIALSIFGKYFLWAGLAAGFIWMDIHVLKTFDASIHKMILILAITPVAANVAAFAAQNDFKPQHAATIVFLTTIISFAFLPFVLPWILGWAP